MGQHPVVTTELVDVRDVLIFSRARTRVRALENICTSLFLDMALSNCDIDSAAVYAPMDNPLLIQGLKRSRGYL